MEHPRPSWTASRPPNGSSITNMDSEKTVLWIEEHTENAIQVEAEGRFLAPKHHEAPQNAPPSRVRVV
jgi:hypothetical protein